MGNGITLSFFAKLLNTTLWTGGPSDIYSFSTGAFSRHRCANKIPYLVF